MGLTAWRHRLSYIRSRPFPTDTEAGRAAERMRRVTLAALAALVGKIASAATTILSVPLTIGYLGQERYGVWLTLSSIIAMLTFADLGIGNGLVTKIAEADGRGDRTGIQILTSSAFAMLCVLAVLLSLCLILSGPFVNWAQLLNVRTLAGRAEVPRAILTLGLVTFAAMPISVISRVQNGLQEGFQVALWGVAGTLASLIALVAATRLKLGLVGLILALSGAPVLMTLVNFGWCFAFSHRSLRPRMRLARVAPSMSLLRMGSLFVVLQLAAAFAYLSDNVVVANKMGSETVAQLAVPAKLFALVLLPVTLILNPLCPAYGEAFARGDVAWVRRMLSRSTWAAVVAASILGLLAVAFGSPIIKYWTRGVVEPKMTVLIALAIWTALATWGHSMAAFLNGTGNITGQAIFGVVFAVAAFSLKWTMVTQFGLPGVIWATTISYALLVVGPISILIRRALVNRADRQRLP